MAKNIKQFYQKYVYSKSELYLSLVALVLALTIGLVLVIQYHKWVTTQNY